MAIPLSKSSHLADILVKLRGNRDINEISNDDEVCNPKNEEGHSDSCNCKKSKCLKLYCQCFASNNICSSNCRCFECMNNNNLSTRGFRDEAVRAIEMRNPHAFESKVKQAQPISNSNNSIDSVPNLFVKCKCRKSLCLKKYCECYQASVPCSNSCVCTNCQNTGKNSKAEAKNASVYTVTRTCEGNSTKDNDPLITAKCPDINASHKVVGSQSKPYISEERLIPVFMKSSKHLSPVLPESTEKNHTVSMKSSRATFSSQPSILRRNSGEFSSNANSKTRNVFSVLSSVRLDTRKSTLQDLQRKSGCLASPESMGIAGALFQLSRSRLSVVPFNNENTLDYEAASTANESDNPGIPKVDTAFITITSENDDKENFCKQSPTKKRALSVPFDAYSVPSLGEKPLKIEVINRIDVVQATTIDKDLSKVKR